MKKIVLAAFILFILPVSVYAEHIREIGRVQTDKGELMLKSSQSGDVYLDILSVRVKFNEEEKQDLLRALETAVDFVEKAEGTDITLTVKTGGIKQKMDNNLSSGISVYFITSRGRGRIFFILKDFSTALFIKSYLDKDECEELINLLHQTTEKQKSIDDQLKLFEM